MYLLTRLQNILIGLVLDSNMNWKNHIKKTYSELQKRLFLLTRLSGKKEGVQTKYLRLFYQSFFRPVYEYASPVWLHQIIKVNPTAKLLKKLRTIDNNAKRAVLGSLRTTPLDAIDAELSILPFDLRQEQTSVIFITKALKHDEKEWIDLALQCDYKSPIRLMISAAANTNAINTTNIYQQLNTNKVPFNQHLHNNIKEQLEHIYNHYLHRWQQKWINSTCGRQLFKLAPIVNNKLKHHLQGHIKRDAEVQITRLRIDHALTNDYNKRKIKKDAANVCRLCNDPSKQETRAHLLLHCKELNAIMKIYNKIRYEIFNGNQYSLIELLGDKNITKLNKKQLKLQKYTSKIIYFVTKKLDTNL